MQLWEKNNTLINTYVINPAILIISSNIVSSRTNDMSNEEGDYNSYIENNF